MIHPPTRCDRSLFLTQEENPKPLPILTESIAKSVAWYERSWQQIADTLLVTVEGVVFTQQWQEVFDYQTLPQWRDGKLSKVQSVAYVYMALRNLFKGLREVSHGS